MLFLPPDVVAAPAPPPDLRALVAQMHPKSFAAALRAAADGYQAAQDQVSYREAPGGPNDRFWRAGYYAFSG